MDKMSHLVKMMMRNHWITLQTGPFKGQIELMNGIGVCFSNSKSNKFKQPELSLPSDLRLSSLILLLSQLFKRWFNMS